jgi:hypothetical protein
LYNIFGKENSFNFSILLTIIKGFADNTPIAVVRHRISKSCQNKEKDEESDEIYIKNKAQGEIKTTLRRRCYNNK